MVRTDYIVIAGYGCIDVYIYKTVVRARSSLNYIDTTV